MIEFWEEGAWGEGRWPVFEWNNSPLSPKIQIYKFPLHFYKTQEFL